MVAASPVLAPPALEPARNFLGESQFGVVFGSEADSSRSQRMAALNVTFRIFVSSVQKEPAAERRAVKARVRGDPVLRRFFEVFLFEDLPASGPGGPTRFFSLR